MEVAAKKLSKEQFQRILSETSKGEDASSRQISPEEFANSILNSIRGQKLVSEQTLEKLRAALIAVAEDMQENDRREIAVHQ